MEPIGVVDPVFGVDEALNLTGVNGFAFLWSRDATGDAEAVVVDLLIR